MGKLLKKSFKILKCGQIPAKADVAAQKAFYEDVLYSLMKRAKNGVNDALLFMDASHFVMGCDFLGRVYARTRRFVKTLLQRPWRIGFRDRKSFDRDERHLYYGYAALRNVTANIGAIRGENGSCHIGQRQMPEMSGSSGTC